MVFKQQRIWVAGMFGACALLGTAVAAQTNTSGFEIEAPSAAVAPETLFVTPEADTLNKSQLDSLGQELSPLTRLAELKEFIKADYPASELKAGREGTVVLQLLVSDSGHVDSATIVRGLSPDFDSAALSVVRRFSFTPALAGSLAVPVYVEYEYRFSIQEEVSKIEQYVNLQGVLKEAGTRTPIKEGMVAITFRDTTADTTLAVPFSAYLSKIGTFPGQHVEEGRLVTFTDSLGRFSFSSLPVGRIRITFPIAGYEPDSAIETIELAKQLAVEYRLRRLTYSEYEIVVYGKMEKEEVGKSTLTLTEVKRIPGFGGDAVKVIQALPGVSRSSFGMGGIVVRGSGSGDSRYFLDGVELPMLFHFGGLKSTYNSVRDISWLGDEKLYLAAGVNYTDINVIDIKTRVMDRASKGTFGQSAYESHPRPFALKKGPWVYYEVQTGSKKFIMFTNQLTGEEKTFECGPGTCGLE